MDTGVDIKEAEAAKKLLAERSIKFQFISYPDGHVIYPHLMDLLNGLYGP